MFRPKAIPPVKMYSKVIICLAFLAVTSAHVSIIDGTARGLFLDGGLSPIIGGLYGHGLRTAGLYPAGRVLYNDVLNAVDYKYTPAITGIQGPSTRTVNTGPDGSTIESVAIGGAVSEDGSVLVGPSEHTFYGRTADQVLIHSGLPSYLPETRSLVYRSGYYPGFEQFPYGKSIVAGPSGTIVAK